MSAFNIIYQPYTYLVGWSEHNLWYYGVRYANKTIPEDDLWVKYFTSSSTVRKLRKDLGEPDVIDIRQKFDSPEKAILWEKTVLRRSNVLNDSKWLNKNIGGATYPVYGENNPNYGGNKGKDNPMYGKSHSEETLLLLSERAKQRTSPNGMTGRTHSEETRMILSAAGSGVNNNQFTGYYITPWGRFVTSKEAVAAAPSKISGFTIMRWCKRDNNKKIHKFTVAKIDFLNKEHIGITFKELGFGFHTVK
jgi:hypothetical protein